MEGQRQDEGGQQFFFDQKSLDIAEKKMRRQEKMANRAGKRERQGT